jgi:hypothetical protein
LLCILEQLSGIKINFHKSEIFCFCASQVVWDTIFSIIWLQNRYISLPIIENTNAL